MNEIVTPPGFVEYPRDPFTRKTELDRLDVMVKGYREVLLALGLTPALCFVEYRHVAFGSVLIPVHCAVLIALFFTTWTGMKRIFGEKGWSLWIALVLCLLPAVIEAIRDLRAFPDLPLLGLLIAVIVAMVWTARRAVAWQFRKLGGWMPPIYEPERIPKVIAALREADASDQRGSGNSVVQSV